MLFLLGLEGLGFALFLFDLMLDLFHGLPAPPPYEPVVVADTLAFISA
jgi:hypothetical protein